MPTTTRPFCAVGSFQKKKDAEATAKELNRAENGMVWAATKKLPHRGKGSAKFGIIRTV